MLYATGDSPAASKRAQSIAISRWAAERVGAGRIRVETNGIRTEVIAMGASALESIALHGSRRRHGMRSLQYVFQKPVTYEEAPTFSVSICSRRRISTVSFTGGSREGHFAGASGLARYVPDQPTPFHGGARNRGIARRAHANPLRTGACERGAIDAAAASMDRSPRPGPTHADSKTLLLPHVIGSRAKSL